MKFDMALKKMKNGVEMKRKDKRFSLKIERLQLMRTTANGAKTLARIASHDVLADDWMPVKAAKLPKAIKAAKKSAKKK